jgi:hypothetical protein
MRELEETENRAGYQVELEERLALAGCSVAKRSIALRETLGQVDADDEDLDEDELEDEEEEFLQVLELEHARFLVDELEREDAGDVADGRK